MADNDGTRGSGFGFWDSGLGSTSDSGENSMARSPDDSPKKITTYRDLEVWKKAMDLVEEVYRITRAFPDDERFGLISQMRRCSVSVPSNIAEGHGRTDRGSFRQHLSIANGSLKELETQLIIVGRLEYITRELASPAWTLAQDVGKMLNRLIASLKR